MPNNVCIMFFNKLSQSAFGGNASADLFLIQLLSSHFFAVT